MFAANIVALVLAFAGASAAPSRLAERQAGPQVTLDYGTWQGRSTGGVDNFLGIPFATPPTGSNRLYQPQPPGKYTGVQDASKYGPSCFSQAPTGDQLAGLPTAVADLILSNPLFQTASQMSEDCLTINVQRPSGTAANAKLPVLVWIYGGGFEAGGSSMYDGTPIISRAVSNGLPLIYVSMNYRLAGFGFLPGAQVKAGKVGNLGLQDQLLALKWVNKYISSFGGDPTHVTIWGESAGAISVASQMLNNGGNNGGPGKLFQAAIMNSGSPIPTGDIANGQAVYDTVVQHAGCSGASDTLQCLRNADLATFKAASDAVPGIFSYESLHLAYLPRTDGVFFTNDAQKLVGQGAYSKIPMITGDCADEGTLFSVILSNITTDQQAITYFQQNYAPKATQTEINAVASAYPSDPRQGSPFDTGYLNAITPEYKRLAAGQGDLVFQAPRRYYLNFTSTTQNTWSYLNRRLMATPVLGSFHGSDIAQYFVPSAGPTTQAQDYIINFASTYDPNQGANKNNLIYWPKWNKANYSMLQYNPDGSTLSLISDNYRQSQMNLLTTLSLKYPI